MPLKFRDAAALKKAQAYLQKDGRLQQLVKEACLKKYGDSQIALSDYRARHAAVVKADTDSTMLYVLYYPETRKAFMGNEDVASEDESAPPDTAEPSVSPKSRSDE